MAERSKSHVSKLASGRASRPVEGPYPAFGIPLDAEPEEAKSASAIPVGAGKWQYEPKWDGFRCLAFKAGNHVENVRSPVSRFPAISQKSWQCCENSSRFTLCSMAN